MNTLQLEESNQLQLQFQKRNHTLPVAVQEISSGQILMIAYVNPAAFKYSITHKIAAFYSTSKNKLWIKGERSGNFLKLHEILVDCDQDALIYKVSLLKGGVCHTLNQKGTNRKACFYRKMDIQTQELIFLEK